LPGCKNAHFCGFFGISAQFFAILFGTEFAISFLNGGNIEEFAKC